MSKLWLAPDHQQFSLRFGLSLPKAKGMKRQGDPARIPFDQFYHLQNMRVSGNQLVSRGGQSKVNTSAETGCIVGIFDAGE